MIPVTYEGIRLDEGFRAALIVGGKIVIELESVETVSAAHKKQLLTYLRLADLRLGYLLDFGAAALKEGITRVVNSLPE